ncbi:acylphosphatase-2 [Zeugodacus cucurbitae]|uniref:acylphosphatase-2 n=1 Tax=Zeugodacus cucurbitae TaxID=28588 RepID=UPI0005967F74|nr:acylphosphatase-2 [Zeugodacus cucurbitae]XP_011193560.1 acylphosphatase-2 [Zeugodacus cucurbitae]XP_054082680.1 acylphosphatase-2 [Zeugodacus cucurbitae]XP_054082681.1 acylphosphatase-2 [Zeugodacus cucurbitae]XP_054082683.1 acylphosphatase-2 [Zeugodacus cucurbitae]
MGIPDIRMLISVEFEVFGHVQGRYFTKYTRDLCTKAGIKGWVKNSKQGSIIGKMQGPKEEVDKMIHWLSKEGSPGCQIEKCVLQNTTTLNRLDYKDFAIRF